MVLSYYAVGVIGPFYFAVLSIINDGEIFPYFRIDDGMCEVASIQAVSLPLGACSEAAVTVRVSNLTGGVSCWEKH